MKYFRVILQFEGREGETEIGILSFTSHEAAGIAEQKFPGCKVVRVKEKP